MCFEDCDRDHAVQSGEEATEFMGWCQLAFARGAVRRHKIEIHAAKPVTPKSLSPEHGKIRNLRYQNKHLGECLTQSENKLCETSQSKTSPPSRTSASLHPFRHNVKVQRMPPSEEDKDKAEKAEKSQCATKPASRSASESPVYALTRASFQPRRPTTPCRRPSRRIVAPPQPSGVTCPHDVGRLHASGKHHTVLQTIGQRCMMQSEHPRAREVRCTCQVQVRQSHRLPMNLQMSSTT
jgi:hypothetical protein